MIEIKKHTFMRLVVVIGLLSLNHSTLTSTLLFNSVVRRTFPFTLTFSSVGWYLNTDFLFILSLQQKTIKCTEQDAMTANFHTFVSCCFHIQAREESCVPTDFHRSNAGSFEGLKFEKCGSILIKKLFYYIVAIIIRVYLILIVTISKARRPCDLA